VTGSGGFRAAAVVVTYNSEQEIGPCLRSLAGLDEVVVIDNDSKDGTCGAVERLETPARLIRNSANRGFAAGANQGFAATSSPLVLLANPDIVLLGGLGELIAVFEDPRIGAAGGKLVSPSGDAQAGFNVRALPTPATLAFEVLGLNRLWPSNPVNRRYRQIGCNSDETRFVEQPAGAFLMVRREVWLSVGGLDERFFPVWFEDVDLCWRIRQAGFRIRYVPGALARHDGAHSIKTLPMHPRLRAWYLNLLRFSVKHFSPAARRGIRLCVYAGLLFRWCATFLGAGNGEDRSAYIQTLRSVRMAEAVGNGGGAGVDGSSAMESGSG
jgi:GT2 family glycosyltransferase